MRKIRGLAIVLGTAAAVAFLIGLAGDHPTLRLLAKPLPVLAMAAVIATCRHGYGRLTATGLVVCALGGVLLEIGDPTFLPGVGAFLVGHLFYTAAFVRETRALRLIRYWIIVLYWLGQLGIAVSALRYGTNFQSPRISRAKGSSS